MRGEVVKILIRLLKWSVLITVFHVHSFAFQLGCSPAYPDRYFSFMWGRHIKEKQRSGQLAWGQRSLTKQGVSDRGPRQTNPSNVVRVWPRDTIDIMVTRFTIADVKELFTHVPKTSPKTACFKLATTLVLKVKDCFVSLTRGCQHWFQHLHALIIYCNAINH